MDPLTHGEALFSRGGGIKIKLFYSLYGLYVGLNLVFLYYIVKFSLLGYKNYKVGESLCSLRSWEAKTSK